MGTPGIPLRKQDILHAIKAKEGLLVDVAEMLNCSRSTIYTWIDTDIDVKNAVDQARAERDRNMPQVEQSIVQDALAMLKNLIMKGDVTATIFALKSKGKWVDKHNNNDQSFEVVVRGKNKDD